MKKDKNPPVRENRAARAAKKRRMQLLGPILCVAVVAAGLLGAAWGPSLLADRIGVMTVSGQPVSAAQFNYYYRDCYDSFRSAYGDYVDSYGLIDSDAGLDEQQYSDDLTWGEFFYNTALTNATRSEVLYAAALQEGRTLTEEEAARVAEKLDLLRSYARSGGYRGLRQFLCSFYGPGASVSSYRNYLQRCAVAEDYYSAVYDGLTYTDEELDAYFAQNYPDAGDSYDYDTVNYREIFLAYEWDYNGDSGEYAATDDSVAQAEATANVVWTLYQDGAKTEASFAALAEQYSASKAADGGLCEGMRKDDSSLESAVSDWVFDGARQPGDADAVEAEYGLYLLYWVGTGVSARQSAALEGLREAAITDWYDALETAADVSVGARIQKHLYYAP